MPQPPNHISLVKTSLKCSNFKCFSEALHGFDDVKPINVIIGRNNTGKTTLLDLVEFATVPSPAIVARGHRGRTPQVVVSFPITDRVVSRVQDGDMHIQADNTGTRYNVYPKRFAESNSFGDQIGVFELATNNSLEFISLPNFKPQNDQQRAIAQWLGSAFANKAQNPFFGYECRRIVADRDILPESSGDSLEIYANGRGLTNVIQRYVNSSTRNRDLVEKSLLRELNSIFRPDAEYNRLLVQQHGTSPSDPWELYLEEEKKGRIPMSQTGSGLKTVLLVLANLLLVPEVSGKNYPLSGYLFCFEELENNLHPAVQRRLFRYLLDRAVAESCHFFITTHSNVVIDLFANDPNAQILHVTHDGESAAVRRVETMEHGHGILDDLDMRASDLLQTNAVVWVEGPSDVNYFNRWIELWTDGTLVDGIHYQCLPVGGSCNAHFSFDSEEIVARLIPALKINRHAILLADSDRTADTASLKVHAKRLADEVAKTGYAWLTMGKEVENYIPATLFQTLCNNPNVKGPALYTNVIEFIAKSKGNRTKPSKVQLAHDVAPLLSRESISGCHDMAIHLDKISELIRKWNRLPAPK
jgi:hypothetical protein